MVTCDQVRHTGHYWTLYSRCDGDCEQIHVIDGGCPECPAEGEEDD